eukprot:gene1590-5523_t
MRPAAVHNAATEREADPDGAAPQAGEEPLEPPAGAGDADGGADALAVRYPFPASGPAAGRVARCRLGNQAAGRGARANFVADLDAVRE